MWTVSRSSFPGLEAPNCSGRRQVGQWHGREHGGSGGLGPGDMGSRGSGSRDVLRHHGIQHRPQKTGPVSSSNRKWGKTRCISPVVTISWSWWYMRCSSVFFGGSSSPEHLLFKRFQTSWRGIDREDFGTESWWRKWRMF
ncbi:hypothetical protein GWK47_002051 [Chionoecetes opilio]|uniref:Uncharacterized protein n=1 Tax=Chionoecetes opilio TaxID=41210 RepID=A0A8J4XQW5_CHIOP|nr:hypothetical protein GWK47_002051 [Chionoecetes opilio]